GPKKSDHASVIKLKRSTQRGVRWLATMKFVNIHPIWDNCNFIRCNTAGQHVASKSLADCRNCVALFEGVCLEHAAGTVAPTTFDCSTVTDGRVLPKAAHLVYDR